MDFTCTIETMPVFFSTLIVSTSLFSINGFVNPFVPAHRRDYRLPSRRHAVQIRDYRSGDADAIFRLLDTSSFDPEGPLDVDCGSDAAIRESYLTDGFFLVASTPNDTALTSRTTTDEPPSTTTMVGTAALVRGTAIAYSSTGASRSTPETITGAVRRVCGSSLLVCEQLLIELERRCAMEDTVQELIALAYPRAQCPQRPTVELLEMLNYRKTETQLPGTNVVQFVKHLDGEKVPPKQQRRQGEDTPEKQAQQDEILTEKFVNGIQGALVAGLLVLSFVLSVSSVAQFMGLDVFSKANSDLGSPLSSEELNRLRQDERLQRTTLDDAIGQERQWNDLPKEEQREEVALMKLIQGQDIRVK